MKQKQIMMDGADTDLSRAADTYLQAVDTLRAAEREAETFKKGLMLVMKKRNKESFFHNGKRIIFRAGHKVDSTIVVKGA